MKIGQLCVKIAGRDAGKRCIIIDEVDSNYVLIDGQTRRRKCNIKHLEPLDKIIKIKKGAANKDVVKALKDLKIDTEGKKEKEKKVKTEKPVKKRKSTEKEHEKVEKKGKKEKKEIKKEKTAPEPKKDEKVIKTVKKAEKKKVVKKKTAKK